jgi:hypothetical protein
MKELAAPLAGEMSGHMFFGGDYLGFDDALFAAARLLEIVSRQPFGLAPLLADLPRTATTPEIRVDVPEAEKFAIVEAAARHFTARYPVNTIDGIRITFPDGWGLLRASNTQPILVLRFEASNPRSLVAARREVVGWRAGRGVRAETPCPGTPAGSPCCSASSSRCSSPAGGRAGSSPIAGGHRRSRRPRPASSPTGTSSAARSNWPGS